MRFRKQIKIEDRAPIGLWLGDSQVWMATAVEKDRTSGRGRNDRETDSHELNVAHVCTGLSFELVLKALAKSEGRRVIPKHNLASCYQALSRESRIGIAQAVKEHTLQSIEGFLEYLDERMCDPDRKYWMVGRKGEARPVGFVENIKGLVIPDLAKVHAEMVSMVGNNAFEDWQEGSRVQTGVGSHLATVHLDESGIGRFEVTEEGRREGVTTRPRGGTLTIRCPQCGAVDWIMEEDPPVPGDEVTCRVCHTTMRADDVVAWNQAYARRQT